MAHVSSDVKETNASETRLPLSTLLLRSTPSHPLVQILASPILPRVALLESILLSHANLLRRIGLSSRGIVALAVLSLGGAIARWRDQWRTMLGILGLSEAMLRSWRVLERMDAGVADQVDGAAMEQQQHEVKHLLSFWIVYALIALGESLRASSTSSTAPTRPVSSRLSPLTRQLRVGLHRLAGKYPSFGFLSPPRAPQRRPFPQPRPRPGDLPPAPLLAVTYLSSEVKYRVVKLLVLWTALRQDGWGASFVWDWVLGPLCAVSRQRAAVQGGGRKRRVVRVVSLDEEDDGDVQHATSISPRQDVFASEDSTTSTPTSPAYSRRSYSSTHESGDSSFTSSTYSAPTPPHGSPYSHASSTNAFPTPDVRFRLASTAHPIRGSIADYHGGITRTDSPTPASRVGSSYAVEPLGDSAGEGQGW